MILNDKKLLDCMTEMRESYADNGLEFEFRFFSKGRDFIICDEDLDKFCRFNYSRIYLLLCDLIEYTIFDNFELLKKVEMKDVADRLTRICLSEIAHKDDILEKELNDEFESISLVGFYDYSTKINYIKHYESVVCFVVENHKHFTELDVGFSNYERNCELYKLWKINKEI